MSRRVCLRMPEPRGHSRISSAGFRANAAKQGVRPRAGGPARYQPQSRPLASIGGSNASQLFVSTWSDIETRPCSNSRFLMSEFERRDFAARQPISAAFIVLVVDETRHLVEPFLVDRASEYVADV